MSGMFEQFHFLRPEWLWALLPAAVLLVLLARRGAAQGQDNWQRYIDAHLLAHLSLAGSAPVKRRKSWSVVALVLALLITGLAGPSWEKADTPSFNGGEPVVAVLSLAQSMNGTDIAPSRLKRAIHKLRDLLAETRGNDRALVIYSDIPFVAAPLTRDAQVIEQMLPELSTGLMPVLGDRPDLAINEASQLLQRTGARSGRIILLTDSLGDRPQASLEAAQAAREQGYKLSVLAVGTAEGATLQTASGQVISDADGSVYVSRLPLDGLAQLALQGGGAMALITPGGEDLAQLLPQDAGAVSAGESSDIRSDRWVDSGYWLLLLPVLAAPLLFRRGLVFGLLCMLGVAGFQPDTAMASEKAGGKGAVSPAPEPPSVWKGLWKTPDQQGSEAFAADDFSTAAQTFESPDWQATALYRAGDYQAAAKEYAALPSGDKDYNLGNSLAHSGDFQGALDAYDRFLAGNPEHENGLYNRELVAKLLEQQQQQQQQQQQEQQQDQGKGQDQSGSGSEGQQESQDQQSGSGSQEQQDQQPGSGSQDQKQDQQSGAGSQDQQQQQSGSGSQDQQQDQQSGSDAQDQQSSSDAQAGNAAEKEAPGLLSQLISDALQGNGEPTDDQQQNAESQASSGAVAPLDQASEQQLRRVPDDPTGLLRARIRQHYARLRAAQ